MIKMISLKPHLYASKRLVAGQQFEARGQTDARLMIALGRAEIAPVVAAPAPVAPASAPRTYRTRAIEAPTDFESPAPASIEDAAETPAVKTTRVYRRRDMKAES